MSRYTTSKWKLYTIIEKLVWYQEDSDDGQEDKVWCQEDSDDGQEDKVWCQEDDN